MSGHRKAALALHTLAREDQQLILAELPEPDQVTLRAYLGELAELGFEQAAVNDVLATKAAPEPRELIAGARAGDIAALLENEPVSFVAALLRIQPWPWEDGFLATLNGHRRTRVELERASAPESAAVRDGFILAELARALRFAAAPSSSPAPTASMSALRPIFRLWKR